MTLQKINLMVSQAVVLGMPLIVRCEEDKRLVAKYVRESQLRQRAEVMLSSTSYGYWLMTIYSKDGATVVLFIDEDFYERAPLSASFRSRAMILRQGLDAQAITAKAMINAIDEPKKEAV